MGMMDTQRDTEDIKSRLAQKDRQIKELQLMHKISKEAVGVTNLDKTLQLIIEEACNAFEAGIGSILLVDTEFKDLIIKAARGLNIESLKNVRVKIGERISGWVAESKEPLLVVDVENDERFNKRSNEKYFNKSLIAAPISCRDEFFGVININNKRSKEVFTEHNLDLLVAIAEQAGIIISNARTYRQLQEVYLSTVSALTEAIDTRDHYTKNHSEHVTKYAMYIGKEMGLDDERMNVLRDASKLHDIGKIGVHDYILMKPGKLTSEEWEEVKLHSLKGVKILQPLTFLNSSIQAIRGHHERFDGKGYPDGKKGEDIPLEARIMAVADSFDAMTTERPYRKAFSVEEAREEMIHNKGTQFDPKVVDAFIRYLDKQELNKSQMS